MQSFVFDDTFRESVGRGISDNIVRIQVHQHTVILSIHNSRLPSLKDDTDYLTNEIGYNAIVKDSGGLSVILDQGALSTSLTFRGQAKTTIDEAFTVTYLLVSKMLENESIDIDTVEIEYSYCPGKFGLSIDGRKFAGMSQRKVRGGIAVRIYLCVKDPGLERASMVQTFYEHTLKGEVTRFKYLEIEPSCMASLEALLNKMVTVQDVVFLLLYIVRGLGGALNMMLIIQEEWQGYGTYLDKMIERNKKMIDQMQQLSI